MLLDQPLIRPDMATGNFFILLFLSTAILLVVNKLLYPKQFSLNISFPNIYIFEFESQSHRRWSLYNLLNAIMHFMAYVLFVLSVVFFGQVSFSKSFDFLSLIKPVFKIYIIFLVAQLFFEQGYLRLIKQTAKLHKISAIRRTYETYLSFYLILLSFFIYYFPYKSIVAFYVIITISIIWFVITLLNFYNSLTKHTELKTYQLFLYLCLTEILPLITLIWWISFQIL